jgi:hypothetical protein
MLSGSGLAGACTVGIVSRFQHPGWVGVFLPLILAIGSTFTPGGLRVVLLVGAVVAATWIFHCTEYAGRSPKKTGPFFCFLLLIAICIFFLGRRFDASVVATNGSSHEVVEHKPSLDGGSNPKGIAPPSSTQALESAPPKKRLPKSSSRLERPQQHPPAPDATPSPNHEQLQVPQPITPPSPTMGGNQNQATTDDCPPSVAFCFIRGSESLIQGNIAIGGSFMFKDSKNNFISGNIADMNPIATSLEVRAGNPEEIEKWLEMLHQEYATRWANDPVDEREKKMNELSEFERIVRNMKSDKEITLEFAKRLKEISPPKPISVSPKSGPAPGEPVVKIERILPSASLEVNQPIALDLYYKNSGFADATNVGSSAMIQVLPIKLKEDVYMEYMEQMDRSIPNIPANNSILAAGQTGDPILLKSADFLTEDQFEGIRLGRLSVYVFSHSVCAHGQVKQSVTQCRTLGRPEDIEHREMKWDMRLCTVTVPKPCVSGERLSHTTIEGNEADCGMVIKDFDNSVIRNNKITKP